MEIVVVDGASTDNTSEIVRSFQQTFPQLRYHLLEKKGGIDLDLANSVERAQGQYCWLFSADDIMESGAVQRMLHEIKSGNDIYICNRKETDLNLNFIGVRYFLDETEQDRVYDLSNKIDLYDYLDKSTSIAAVFSYMSSIVFLEKWNNVKDDHRFIGSSYHHAFKLLSF
jgi:abequosyltransferase